MEVLDVLRSLIYSVAYLIVVSIFFVDNKKRKSILYLLVIFTIVTVAVIISGFEVYINYLVIAATTITIGKNYGYLKGFSHTLTIFAVFQWGTALVGSLIFIFVGQPGTGVWLPFVFLFYCMISAYLLRRFSQYTFREELSRVLLIINVCAKIFFILFFNVLFPRFFGYLGAEPYSVLAIILLFGFAFFAVYQEYSLRLEKQIALQNHNLQQITLWAAQTIAKYEGVRLENAEKIGAINNPIVQALLYDFTATTEKLGIEVNITVSGSFEERINLNNFDLFQILADFLDNALLEVKKQTDTTIYVGVDGKQDCFRFTVKTSALDAEEHYTFSDFKLAKDNIVSQIKKNRNISISYSKVGAFVQALEIH